MQLDHTLAGKTDAALAELAQESERRKRIQSVILDSISDFVYLLDRDGRFLFANKRLLDLWNLPLERVVGRNFYNLKYPRKLADKLHRQISQVFATGQAVIDETLFTDLAGLTNFYEYIFSPVLASDGSVEFVVGATRDVTERTLATEARTQAQESLIRSSRVLVLRSQINALIVRATNRDQLFREVCRIAVEQGGFLISMICSFDPATARISPIASAGMDETLLASVNELLSSADPAAQSLLARAVYERRALTCNDARNDPNVPLGPVYAEHGVNSLAVLPLVVADQVVGILALCASTTNFFHAEEVRLLTELADDISFAIDHIAKSQGLVYLNRVYAMLSSINSLIIRARSRDELFKDACRIAVDVGGFRGAMMGVLENGELRFAAVSATSEVEAAAARKMLEAGQGRPTMMAKEAIESQQPSISNDSQHDPNVAFREAHAAFGVHSLAIFPLIIAGQTTGTFSLYASESDFFHAEEIKLLTALTGDVAFAMEHIDKQDRLEYLAYYDTLTGLANRSLFLERAAQALRSSASVGHGAAMIMLDLERFKSINDSLGQAVGDELLKQVGAWLGGKLPDPSLLARVGSDQFAVILPEVRRAEDAAHQLEPLILGFHEHAFLLQGEVFRIAAKFGVAMFPEDGEEALGLFKKAESALKNAKGGGDRQLFYTEKMTESVARKLTLENQLRQALDNEEFVLHYQPKVNLRSGHISSAEALIRWNDPRIGLVSPGQFIPVLEETGLIFEVGRWALRQALKDYLRWHRAGLPAVRIAVNVSPLQLRNPGFVDEIARLLAVDEHAAAGLELEITESMIMGDIERSIAILKSLREMSIRVSIDDFGTGFSSLGYLARLPIDTLKIDLSFVRDMNKSPEGLALVSTIITLARSLHLNVVAEGVETDEQAKILRLLRCDEMQGYLFSKPVPGDEFEARFLRLP
jgi:diguanylate cyclase (GGDEF)-like protein/PAS domain S-box-containing protein